MIRDHAKFTLEQLAQMGSDCYTISFSNIQMYRVNATESWYLINGNEKDRCGFWIQESGAIFITHQFNYVMYPKAKVELARNYARYLLNQGYTWEHSEENQRKAQEKRDSAVDHVINTINEITRAENTRTRERKARAVNWDS